MSKVELLVTQKVGQLGLAVCLKPKVSQVFTPTLVHEIRKFQNELAEKFYKKSYNDLFYVVWYLYSGNIPWQGLDFNFIKAKLKDHQDTEIINYINELFDLLLLNYISLGYPLINCSVVTRNLKGISKEFFWMNQINFLKTPACDKPKLENTQSLYLIQLHRFNNVGCFPKDIYLRNQFYGCSKFNFKSMRKILKEWHYAPMSIQELETTRATFEAMKVNTISTIFKLASKKMRLIDRMARMQLYT